MSTGLELQVLDVRTHEQFLVRQSERIDKWCKGDVRAESLQRFVLHEMSMNNDLRQCTPTSIYLAILACAANGLVPGKIRNLCYLVPFNNTVKGPNGQDMKVAEATFMRGWRGVKHQGYRAGLQMVSADIHRNDTFDYDKGTKGFVRYRAALEGRGPVIGAAAWTELPNGRGVEVEYMDVEELEKVRAFACKFKPSPAWNGDFKNQMQRKSAMRRLGNQIEMGEEFFAGELIENAQDEGSLSTAIDALTDGEATRIMSQQSVEAATFGALPRPAQAQVPAQLPAGPAPAKPAAAAKPKAAAAPAPAAPAGQKLDEAKAKVENKSRPPAAPTSSSGSPATANDGGTPPARSEGNPTAGAAGSTAQPSQASPAASSPASSGTASNPSTSSESSPAQSTESSSSASTEEDGGDFGDVANEPGPDEDFDASFGEDPEDSTPQAPVTREQWVAAFQAWAAAHPTREQVNADASWQDVFRGWCAACQSKAEMDADKPVFINWAKGVFSVGRKADPSKGITALAPDPGSADMQKIFAHRYKQVP
ncbi:MAG TPA: recombinase RecT [Methylomirabilota bacterium]|nr:recombinase RecT [Methylomirabilota bacterium]